jgi:dimethylargininase
MKTSEARQAITRTITDSFTRALARHAPAEPIDVARARAQHLAYLAALREIGLDTIELPADERFPDGCFVEDCALVAGGVVLITRLGASSRRGEEVAVAEALGRRLRLERMAEPATLDGGDCLRVGERIFIGRSARTNDAGIGRAREVFAPLGFTVVAVEVAQELHLKSVCSPLDDRRMLLAAGSLAPEAFAGVEIILIDAHEAIAANAVGHAGRAIVAAGCPGAARAIERAGFGTVAVDTSEMRKADGALTCLSILF